MCPYLSRHCACQALVAYIMQKPSSLTGLSSVCSVEAIRAKSGLPSQAVPSESPILSPFSSLTAHSTYKSLGASLGCREAQALQGSST